MDVEQYVFSGGINQLDDDTGLQDDQYRLLINGRSRYGKVIPIKKSVEQDTLPAGNYQGGIGIGSTALVFVSGKAYYQVHGTSAWNQITSFSMDATARRLYAISVPKSTQDYVRKRNGSLNNPIVLGTDFNVAGNPAGILVQDGINQPWLIQFDAVSQTFVARVTKTYTDWANVSTTANDREYVPVGLMMFFINQKLYIVAPDRKSIYQSVTGRPLDFMVNVDGSGNKLPTESLGGADTVSFAFDGDDITFVQSTNITDTFVYGTARYTRLIQLDYTSTIFGEPTYRQAQIIEAGVVNQESFIELLGDYAFIDNDGIKSFNAVANYRVEGRNSVFSAMLSALVEDKLQVSTVAAAISFSNFGLFYCNTILGRAILVYDTLRTKWVALDIIDLPTIRQFFVVSTGAVDKLYAVCEDKLMLMYSGDEREVCQLYMRALTPENQRLEHKGAMVKPIFQGCTYSGTCRIIEYVDDQYSDAVPKRMAESVMALTFPLQFPFIFSSKPNVIADSFIFTTGRVGKKIAYVLVWDTDAALMGIKIVTSEQDRDAASRQSTHLA